MSTRKHRQTQTGNHYISNKAQRTNEVKRCVVHHPTDYDYQNQITVLVRPCTRRQTASVRVTVSNFAIHFVTNNQHLSPYNGSCVCTVSLCFADTIFPQLLSNCFTAPPPTPPPPPPPPPPPTRHAPPPPPPPSPSPLPTPSLFTTPFQVPICLSAIVGRVTLTVVCARLAADGPCFDVRGSFSFPPILSSPSWFATDQVRGLGRAERWKAAASSFTLPRVYCGPVCVCGTCFEPAGFRVSA